MKKVLIFSLLMCVILVGKTGSVFAATDTNNNIVFPDQNLKNALINRGVDTNYDNEISVSEANTVTSLNLYSCNITDISGMEYFIHICYLYIRDNNISDISSLSNLTNLDSLDLSYNNISDINSISYLTNLTSLNLYDNHISDISSLSNLTNLTHLFLTGNNISDISSLCNLTKLVLLWSSNNNISDISSLSNLTNLTSLTLGYNRISDISSLSNLTNLTELSLDRNIYISDISSLSNLTNLKYLTLGQNNISDISSLSNLTNLTALILYYNNISDIGSLRNLTKLNTLWIDYNKISNISSLSNLTNLIDLSLDYNLISDISSLSNLTTLTRLALYENNISDISSLSNLTKLTSLDLRNNPINNALTRWAVHRNDMDFIVNGTLYEVWVIDNTQNNDLQNLSLTQGSLSPAFNRDTLEYSSNVSNDIKFVQVSPTVDYEKVIIKVNGELVSSGQTSSNITLDIGINNIEIVVIAENGNEKKYIIKVNRELPPDSIPPIITIGDYIMTPTNQDITVTASVNEGTLNATSHTFPENSSFTFTATDEAGNTSSKEVTITNIDKVAPVITIESYTTTPTNQDITVTASTNEGTLNTTSKTFTANGSFTFTATDEAGNTASKAVTISNIDKTAPTTPMLSADKTTATNGNVVVTITYPVDATTKQYKVGSTGTWTIYTTAVTISANDIIYARCYDNAGNVSTEGSLVIGNIDKTAPVITLGAYDGSTPTNQDITVTASTNEGTLNSVSHVFTVNGSFAFTATDEAGNISSKTVTINNIDRTAPDITLGEYDGVTPTNKDITVTATTIDGTLNETSHTFTENGSFTFTATDEAGNTSSQEVTITNIDKVAPVITIEPYTNIPINQDITVTASVNEGTLNATGHTFTENGSFTFTATDEAGNTSSKEVTISNIDKVAPVITIESYPTLPTNQNVTVNVSVNEGTLNATGHTFTENGSFTFTAKDGAGNTSSEEVTISNIDKVAPSIKVSFNECDVLPIGTALSFTSLDPNSSEPVTLSAKIITGIEEIVIQSGYKPNAGVYKLFVTAADVAGNVTEQTINFVVYDPEGGFVTGGGWIDSPKGAYTLDPSLSGKATFGFVSKYKKGATIPTGQTEFAFKAGSLEFYSSCYDWLVVAGSRAQFKGKGTLNGQGEYGFMLTAIDGGLKDTDKQDRFRIKIWNIATDEIVYDNQIGTEDSSDLINASTTICGGSIVIHK